MRLWLPDEEVAELTRAKRVSKQVEVLTKDGVPFRMVAGRPIVMVSALENAEPEPPEPQLRLIKQDKSRRRRKPTTRS